MDTVHADIMHYCVECTAADNQTCQIAQELSTINKLLFSSMVQLQELPDTSGQLHLADISSTVSKLENLDSLQLPRYPELIGWLLRTHRCISSASVTVSFDDDTCLRTLDAIGHSLGVEKLKLNCERAQALNCAYAVIPSLTKIKELDCTGNWRSADRISKEAIAALSELLTSSSFLETLRFCNFPLGARLADTFMTSLRHTSTLKELDLQSSPLKCGSYPEDLTEYLSTTTLLKVLAVDMTNEFVQMAVLLGLSENRSIEKLTIGKFIVNYAGTAIMARVISSNRVVRNLTISSTGPTKVWTPSIYDSWILPLTENDTLEELSFPLEILYSFQWEHFFRALPKKRNLKKFRIGAKCDQRQLPGPLYESLKSRGFEEKVVIECYCISQDFNLLHCKSFSEVSFGVLSAENIKTAALRIMPNCHHLTSMDIAIHRSDVTLPFALAEFLELTKALRKLHLVVCWRELLTNADDCPWWPRLLEALAQNNSLKLLDVILDGISDQEMEGLADSVRRSTSITSVIFGPRPKGDSSTFVRRLAVDIAKNYTLMNIYCSGHVCADAARDWFTVQETTWRNAGLVARAARLLKASISDRYVIEALERISLHPALLAEVAEKLEMDKAELIVLSRERLKVTESLNGFMRITGVVKERVVCNPPDDNCTQLDDLNQCCWMHVRRYLLIDDVKHEPGQARNVEDA
ncbi:hypothetical protein HPB50_012188 [Hyalomma asiaticum]|uniref:Uncharacterized protein n=1 Tax=Hyalomma asiaticum TaxID=266040 RepID=A0ACB7RLR7_HYAAI|nr:hypothetical protein HPB50_012188 [Hyalomma asiaticum]